jgi:hypothetical protein
MPGNLADAQLALMQKTASLTVYHNGVDVQINDRRMTPTDGLISLVKDHGLRETCCP